MVRVQVVRRFTLNGTIDKHDPIGVTLKVTHDGGSFRLTVFTINLGRGYRRGEFRANVEQLMRVVGDREYVVLLLQEIDEADPALEHQILSAELGPGWTLVGWGTREPIAVSPGVDRVTRRRKRLTMRQGTAIGAPVGTGPDRYLVSCVAIIEGIRVGCGCQHPHRNLGHPKVQSARREGEQITAEVVGELAEVCDLVGRFFW